MASTKYQRIFISQKKLDEKYEGIVNTITLLNQKPISNRKEIVKLVASMVPEYRRPLTEINAEIAITAENGELSEDVS